MPDYKESVQKAFGPAVAGAPDIRHIQHLVGDFNAPFAAPVTEIATFKLKEGTTLDGLREQIGVLGGELSAASHAIAWGDCVEHPDTLVALLGWPSIDVLPPPHFGMDTKFVYRHTEQQRKGSRQVKSLAD